MFKLQKKANLIAVNFESFKKIFNNKVNILFNRIYGKSQIVVLQIDETIVISGWFQKVVDQGWKRCGISGWNEINI